MFIRTLFCLLLLALSFDALAQNVTFTGKVSRHELSDRSVEVQGFVHIRFGFPNPAGPDSDVLVPFTILAGQTAVGYSKTVPWSFAGSIDEEYYDFFTIDVSCTRNCSAAGVSDEIAYYDSKGDTVVGYSSYTTYAERFGESERAGGYVVNLTLRPNFGFVNGQFSLPDGQRAQQDIELFVVALDYGFCCYATWMQVIQQPVVIRAGQNSASFRFIISEDELAQARYDRLSLGYSCRSEACAEHGLIERAWLTPDLRGLVTNDAQAPRIDFPMTGSSSFTLTLPSSVTLLQREETSVVVSRIAIQQDDPGAVEGRVIVEKLESGFTCDFYPVSEINWDENLDSFQCFEHSIGQKDVVVSETPFSIPATQFSATVALEVEPMLQDITAEDDVEHQRIRFECDSGCSSFPYAEQGYFRGFDNRFSASGAHSAYKFQQSGAFDQDEIVLSLRQTPVLSHLYELLLRK